MMGRRKRGQVDGLSPSETHDRVAPFVAPVAAHSGAVIHHADEFVRCDGSYCGDGGDAAGGPGEAGGGAAGFGGLGVQNPERRRR